MATTAELQRDVSSFLETYITAFNNGDLGKVASFYDEPCAFLSASSGVTVFSRQKDLIDSFTKTVDRLKAEGWAHSEYAGEKGISALDSNHWS